MIRRRVIVIVALAIMMFTATSSVLFELRSAPAAFAGSADHVILSNDAPTIFSSQVDVGIIPLLLAHESITDAWAEVVIFSVWGEEAFVVRGMDVELLLHGAVRIPAMDVNVIDEEITRTSALAGTRLMSRLGIEPPCVIPLSGSYASRVEFVQVIGWFEAESPMDDELIVSEDVARYLGGMPSESASLIAVAADDTSWLEDVLSPEAARFAMFNVHASKTMVVPGEGITITMEVRNWGAVEGETTVRISDGGALVDETTLSLDASASTIVERQLTFESKGPHPLDIRLSGDFPSNVSIDVSVVDPYLVVIAPSRVLLNSAFDVSVVDHDGDPVPEAEVAYSVDGAKTIVSTDEAGAAEITLSTAGPCLLTASHSGYSDASTTVDAIDLAAYPDEFLPGVASFSISDETLSESEDLQCAVVVENTGAVGGTFNVTVSVDSAPRTVLSVQLGPAELRAISFSISDVGIGTHTVQVGTFSIGFAVEPWFADEPDLVQLALRYGGTGVLSSSASIPIYQAAKISEGNVAVALFSIGAVSALLTSLAISAAFAKEIREGRRTLGILRTIGASKRHIRNLVLPQALMNGLVGAVAGIIAGLAVTIMLTNAGVFYAFGHALALEPNAPLLLLVAIGAAAISVSSAFASAEIAARSTPISSIKDLDDGGISEHVDLEESPSEE